MRATGEFEYEELRNAKSEQKSATDLHASSIAQPIAGSANQSQNTAACDEDPQAPPQQPSMNDPLRAQAQTQQPAPTTLAYIVNFRAKLRESERCCACIDMALGTAAKLWLAIFAFASIFALIIEGGLIGISETDWFHYWTDVMIFKDIFGFFIIAYAIWGLYYCDRRCLEICHIYFIAALALTVVHFVILIIRLPDVVSLISIGIYAVLLLGIADTFRKVYLWCNYFVQHNSSLNMNRI